MIKIQESKTHYLGFGVGLEFQLTQHVRDVKLMESLIKYFDCGKIFKDREAIDFKVTKTKDFTEKILPFFFKIPSHWCESSRFCGLM